MIEGHEHDGGPAFELYALKLEHKHVPETAALLRFVAPADLRAVGRALPPGHAGVGAAASRYAAGQADRLPICMRCWRRATGAASSSRSFRPTTDGKLEPQGLNETNLLELTVHANEKHRQAVLVARLDNLGKGASGAAVQNLRLMLGPSRWRRDGASGQGEEHA